MARNSLTPFGSFGRDPFTSLQHEMNRLFDDAFRGFGAGAPVTSEGRSMVETRMNVAENDKEIRVTAELPGVREQDVDVTLDGDVLTIRGEKKFEHETGGEKDSYHFVERSYGSFQRSLRLPYAVNPEEVKADFENGVLTLTIPKTAQQQRSRKIQIGGGGARAEGAQPQIAPTGNGEGQTERQQPPTGGGEQPVAH